MTASPDSWRPWLLEARQRHIVQFYRRPAFLGEAVALWASRSLRRGGGAVLIGTPGHLEVVRARLEVGGLDVPALEKEGRLGLVEAQGLLETFLVDGQPDRERFRSVLDPILAGVRGASRPGVELRAWGEMVDVLRREGNLRASKRLEGLWNEVLDDHDLRLLCSYAVDNLDPATHPGLFEDLTAGHARLLPEQDLELLEASVARAMADVFGERDARVLTRTILARNGTAIDLPPGEATLVGLFRVAPQLGARVLEHTRRHYQRPLAA